MKNEDSVEIKQMVKHQLLAVNQSSDFLSFLNQPGAGFDSPTPFLFPCTTPVGQGVVRIS